MIYCIIAGAEDEDLGKVVQELEAENKRLKLTIDGMCEMFFGYTETVCSTVTRFCPYLTNILYMLKFT